MRGNCLCEEVRPCPLWTQGLGRDCDVSSDCFMDGEMYGGWRFSYLLLFCHQEVAEHFIICVFVLVRETERAQTVQGKELMSTMEYCDLWINHTSLIWQSWHEMLTPCCCLLSARTLSVSPTSSALRVSSPLYHRENNNNNYYFA